MLFPIVKCRKVLIFVHHQSTTEGRAERASITIITIWFPRDREILRHVSIKQMGLLRFPTKTPLEVGGFFYIQ